MKVIVILADLVFALIHVCFLYALFVLLFMVSENSVFGVMVT